MTSLGLAKYGSICNKETKVLDRPSKKQRVDNGMKVKEMRCVVNSLNSLWVCRNAMNPKHECIFCMCNQCYINMVNNNRKGQCNTRGRRNQMKSKDDNIKKKYSGD